MDFKFKITYEDSDQNYKEKFNSNIKKQVNHLINEINRSAWVDDKMIGCASIILTGLSYKDKEKYLNYGLGLLKKITNFSFDSEGFPKSRNLRQLILYLKYFILIRELLKESQNEVPEYLDEIIFHLGQSYCFTWQNTGHSLLFNGNHEENNSDFDKYLKFHGYKFKNESNEYGGYVILKNKNVILAVDLGSSPEKNLALIINQEHCHLKLFFNGKKLISNSGYFKDPKHQLNSISKSTATHSTLVLDNRSTSKMKKNSDGILMMEKRIKDYKKNQLLQKKIIGVYLGRTMVI